MGRSHTQLNPIITLAGLYYLEVIAGVMNDGSRVHMYQAVIQTGCMLGYTLRSWGGDVFSYFIDWVSCSVLFKATLINIFYIIRYNDWLVKHWNIYQLKETNIFFSGAGGDQKRSEERVNIGLIFTGCPETQYSVL